jgi:hypothetical protein
VRGELRSSWIVVFAAVLGVFSVASARPPTRRGNGPACTRSPARRFDWEILAASISCGRSRGSGKTHAPDAVPGEQPATDCPATSGNSDIYGGSSSDPTL